MYEYRGTVAKIVDGDTVDLTLDLGFRMQMTDRFRLFGVNAPELHASDSSPGKAAKAALEALLPVGSCVIVRTDKDKKEKYGRWLATIATPTCPSVADALVAGKHATAYDGGKR